MMNWVRQAIGVDPAPPDPQDEPPPPPVVTQAAVQEDALTRQLQIKGLQKQISAAQVQYKDATARGDVTTGTMVMRQLQQLQLKLQQAQARARNVEGAQAVAAESRQNFHDAQLLRAALAQGEQEAAKMEKVDVAAVRDGLGDLMQQTREHTTLLSTPFDELDPVPIDEDEIAAQVQRDIAAQIHLPSVPAAGLGSRPQTQWGPAGPGGQKE